MAMTREESEDLIEELKEELEARPTKTVEVIQITEVVIENSAMGTDGMGELFGALAIVQGALKATSKDSEAHKYNYADLEAVLNNAYPLTSKNGLSVVQVNVSKTIGKTVFVGVKTILGHKGGGWISGEIYIPVMKTKMNTLVQMAGVSVSYLRRYGVQSILGMATTDNDGSDK